MTKMLPLFIVLLLLAGCGRIQNERVTGAGTGTVGVVMDVNVEMDDSPRVGEEAQVLITLTQDGAPVSGATLTVEGNMTHAGMEPLILEARESEPGRYRAPLTWTMGGAWIVTVRGTLPDGTAVEQTVEELNVES